MPNYGMPIDQPQFNLAPAQGVPVSTIQERSLPMSPMPGEAVPMQYAGQVAPRQVVVTQPVGQAAPPVQNTVRVANNNYNVAGGAPYSADTGIAPPIVHRSPYTTLTHMTSPYTGQVFTLQGYPSRSPHMIYGDLFDTTAPYMNALIPWIMGGMQAQGQAQGQAKTSGGGGTAKDQRQVASKAATTDVYGDSNLMEGFLRGTPGDTSNIGNIGLGSGGPSGSGVVPEGTSVPQSRSQAQDSSSLAPWLAGGAGLGALVALLDESQQSSSIPHRAGMFPVSVTPTPVASESLIRAGNFTPPPSTPSATSWTQRLNQAATAGRDFARNMAQRVTQIPTALRNMAGRAMGFGPYVAGGLGALALAADALAPSTAQAAQGPIPQLTGQQMYQYLASRPGAKFRNDGAVLYDDRISRVWVYPDGTSRGN